MLCTNKTCTTPHFDSPFCQESLPQVTNTRLKDLENSLCRKLLACIPIIGIYASQINENSLDKKILYSPSKKRKTTLLSIKNHYKIASIAREILTIASVITFVAFASLSTSTGIFLVVGAGFLNGRAAQNHYLQIFFNEKKITKLKTSLN